MFRVACNLTSPKHFSRFSSRRRYSSNVNEVEILRDKIHHREPNRALPQEWYTSNAIFEADLRFLWKKQWLCVGYEFQIREPGDYFTYQLGNESVVVCRGDDGKIRAFFNVCRHRGARICTQREGKVKNLTCPYHAWTYDKTGKLIKANNMEGQIKFEDYSLFPCHVKNTGGLLFLNFADNPTYPFEPAEELLEKELKHHQLENAKIAYMRRDIVKANWKVVYENNRECYHCPNAHPEYIKSNYDLMFSYVQKQDGSYEREIDLNHPRKVEAQQQVENSNKRWLKYGLQCAAHNNFPGDGWYRASRMPLRKGWVSESIDGSAVAPILGEFEESDRDMGSLRIHTLPNFWLHLSSDHGVSSILTPIDPLHTQVESAWIVHKDAKEGVDYELSKLTPFWEKTNLSDWEICEWNQLGILSDKYSPAPYSIKKEGGVENFIKWYLRSLEKGANAQQL